MKKTNPPGPDSSFFGFSNIIGYKSNPLRFLQEVTKKHGDLVHFAMGKEQIYLLNRPDLIQQTFSDNWQKLNKPELLRASNRSYWGDGLTTLEGNEWKKRRRLMQPAFHEKHITAYASTIIDCTQDLLKNWRHGQVVNIEKEMFALTVRIAVRLLFDAELEGFNSANDYKYRSGIIPFEEAKGIRFTTGEDNHDLPSAYFVTRLRAGSDMDTTIKIIKARFASREAREDMLTFLLDAIFEDGHFLSQEDVIGEVLQMLFAGHHTIPQTLVWLWLMLAQNPQIEARMHQELLQVSNREDSWHIDNLIHLQYTKMVIKETLRYHPLTLILSREIVDAFSLESYTLKKGASIWVSPYLLHHDVRNFEHPTHFWPERFSQENIAAIPKYAYCPFGVPPRICIGQRLAMMEIQLIWATIAQSFRLVPMNNQNILPKIDVVMKPTKTVDMKITSRCS